MASIGGTTRERVIPIKRWFGLNENPDGDTKLKYGEAAYMRNFQVTRDGNLKLRDGTALTVGLCQSYVMVVASDIEVARDGEQYRLVMYPNAAAGAGTVVLSGVSAEVTKDNWESYVDYFWRGGPYEFWKFVEYKDGKWYMKAVRVVHESLNPKVAGLWSGLINGNEYFLAACDGKLWSVSDGERTEIGNVNTDNTVHIFGFENRAYVLDGVKYRQVEEAVVNGETVLVMSEPEGYVPIVAITSDPAGGGTEFEQVNKLNGKRKVWFSSDNTATVYHLPEKDLTSIDSVYNRMTMEEYDPEDYSIDTAEGTVEFDTAPPTGTNSIEIAYTVPVDARSEVEAMRFSELFNGAQDNRIFLYGDGSNKILYSGVDYDGHARADYFPDMNIIDVGAANTPVTGMVRHYGWLMTFKTDSSYGITYGDVTLADGRVIPSFYVKPVNRSLGNLAMGQARLVLNHPRTVHGQDCYEWQTSYNQTDDERQAKRISDRVYASLANFDLKESKCWDDDYHQEYYISYDKKALVHNYASDAWYLYTDVDAVCFASVGDRLYFGTSNGELKYFDPNVRADCGAPIDCYWESGSMDFGEDYRRKYSSMIWVGLKPTEDSEITVTVQTDKKSVYTEKVVQRKMATFAHADFSDWSFETNYKPWMQRLKIKAKKFTYYKLVFKSLSDTAYATVVGVEMRVRYNGYVR